MSKSLEDTSSAQRLRGVANGSFAQETQVPQQKQDPKFLRLFAGGASAFVSTAVTCPLDVIKTRQQSSWQFAAALAQPAKASSAQPIARRGLTTFAQPRQSTFLQQMMFMWRTEGVRSLFKGLAPSLIGAVSSRALFFWTYEGAKEQLGRGGSFVDHVIAATAGGVVCTTLTCPLWVIKLRQQLHKRHNSNSLTMRECMVRTWRKEGPRGFFRGLFVSYAGVAEMIVYFSLYEQLRDIYMRHRHGLFPSHQHSMRDMRDLPGLMALSGFARCVSCLVCYPAEVARVRVREELIQKRYCRTLKTLVDVATNEGLRGLYGGLSAQLTRQAFNMAILMGVYEAIIYQYRRHDSRF